MRSPVLALRFLAGIVVALALTGTATAPARAADASCKQLFKIRSKNSNTPTRITFVNNASTVRAVMWLDFNGQPQDFGQMQLGESLTFDTFLTHPWMVVTGPGDCLQIVMPSPGGSVIRLTDAGADTGEEGSSAQTSCPAGTVPVPETDNCVKAPAAGGSSAGLPMYGRSLGGVMRTRPDMGSRKVASIAEGTRVEILRDAGVAMNGYQWFKVRAGDWNGYQWGGIMCSDAPLPGIFQVCQ
jgi:hypothetical protein